MLLQNITKFIRGLPNKPAKGKLGIVVACSGGTDSMVLLDLLGDLAIRGDISLVVAHYDHGIRGLEANLDAEFVETYARGRGIAFELGRGNVPDYAKSHKLSVELAARELRYVFLEQVRIKHNLDYIATAHHQGDMAETVIMRILRGAGTAGLVAMRPLTGNRIKPLLNISRAALERYAEQKQLNPREDSTNSSLDYFRNRVRHDLLPYIRKNYNPAIDNSLIRLGDIAGEDEDFLNKLASQEFIRITNERNELSLVELKKMHIAVQRRLLRLFWTAITGSHKDFSYANEEILRELTTLDMGTGTRELPGGYIAYARYGYLSIEKNKPTTDLNNHNEIEINLPNKEKSAIISFLDNKIQIDRLARVPDSMDKYNGNRACIDITGIDRLLLRTRRAGDYIDLKVGRRKLKDIFIDDKIPREARDEIMLLARANTSEIVWIAGNRLNTRYLADGKTDDVLVITVLD